MVENYNEKSCNAKQRVFYRPIEAAIRWCNLAEHESDILIKVGTKWLLSANDFPQWPCLRANIEKIIDAINNKELSYGRDGVAVADGEQVASFRRTVRHNDLKAWMAKHYPDQKPDFLFDEIERNTHPEINTSSFLTLQAERDELKRRILRAEDVYREMKECKRRLERENDTLKKLDNKERETLLITIAALAKEAEVDISKISKAGENIAAMTQQLGTPVGATTIETHLKKIPQALENRSK